MMRRRTSRSVDQSGRGHNPNADEDSRDPRSDAASSAIWTIVITMEFYEVVVLQG